MSNKLSNFLNPTCYIPEDEIKFATVVKDIYSAKSSGVTAHFKSVAKATYTVGYALLSAGCHVTKGTGSLIRNIGTLSFNLTDTKNSYKKAGNYLAYSALATLHIALGVLIPSILKRLDSQSDSDRSINLAPHDDIEMSRVETTRDEVLSTGSDTTSTTSEPAQEPELDRQEQTPQAPPPITSTQQPQSSDNTVISPSFSLPQILQDHGIQNPKIFAGQNGFHQKNQAYRLVLNAYISILQDEHNIDLNQTIETLKEWTKNNGGASKHPMLAKFITTLYCLNTPHHKSSTNPTKNDSLYLPDHDYVNAQEQYQTFCALLKDTLETDDYQTFTTPGKEPNDPLLRSALTRLHTLCYIRFFGPQLHSFFSSLIHLHVPEFSQTNLTIENFAGHAANINAQLEHIPPEQKTASSTTATLQFTGAIGYKNFLHQDLLFPRGVQIFKASDQSSTQSFHYLRHPTPHIAPSIRTLAIGTMQRIAGYQDSNTGESIAPEFKGMLRHLASTNQSYLIESHQRLNDPIKPSVAKNFESEYTRCETLDALQDEYPNCHVLFQSVDSPLFYGQGKYAVDTTLNQLKTQILDSFDSSNRQTSPNRLPRVLEADSTYRDTVLPGLLDFVHDTFFNNSEEVITPQQRQAFFLFFYILQGHDAKCRLKIHGFSTHCKDFLDRGGSRALAEDVLNLFLTSLQQDALSPESISTTLKDYMAHVLPVGLISKGTAVIPKRLDPALHMIRILGTLDDAAKEKCKTLSFPFGNPTSSSNYRFSEFKITKHAEQHAVPTFQDCKTTEEAQVLFRDLQLDVQKPGNFYYKIENLNFTPSTFNLTQPEKIFKKIKVLFNQTYYDGIIYPQNFFSSTKDRSLEGLKTDLQKLGPLRKVNNSEDCVNHILAHLSLEIFKPAHDSLIKLFETSPPLQTRLVAGKNPAQPKEDLLQFEIRNPDSSPDEIHIQSTRIYTLGASASIGKITISVYVRINIQDLNNTTVTYHWQPLNL